MFRYDFYTQNPPSTPRFYTHEISVADGNEDADSGR